MSYLDLIRNFWIVHDANSLGITETALYFYLLEVNNKCRWVKVFNRNSSKIKVDLSISHNTLKKACDVLKSVGLIDYESKNGSAIWLFTLSDTISNFDKVADKVDKKIDDTLSVTLSDTLSNFDKVADKVDKKIDDTLSVTLSDTLSKFDKVADSLNKTKDKDKDIPPLVPQLENFKNEMLSDETWKQAFSIQSGMSLKMLDILPCQLDKFFLHVISTGEKEEMTLKDAKRYFTYWWRDHGKPAYEKESYWNGPDESETFSNLKKWIKDNTPNLAKIKQQLTYHQLTDMLKLTEDNREIICDVLRKMNNDNYVVTKSASVYDSWKDKYYKLYGK